MFFPFRLAPAVSFILVSFFLLPPISVAGPNAGGVLILHDVDYWSCTQCDPCEFPLPDSCEDVDSREDSFETVLLHVIAGFPTGASPRVADVAFGLDYDDHEVFLSSYSNCGPTEWFGDQDWPAAGSGVQIRFTEPTEDLNTALMFVAAYNYYGSPKSLALIEHPDLGAVFLDDSDPPVVDLIADLGSFGFAQDGHVPCVDDLNQGACCRADGSCDLTDLSRCFASGGAYLGDDTSCDPDPCSATRACCASDGSCSLTTATDCSVSGGVFDSSATACDPNPCREPFGGCCLEVGLCLLATESTCFGTYGSFNPTYFGDGTGCDDSCLGACCLTDGSCTLAYEFVCDGDFLGSMSLCEPNPCAPTNAPDDLPIPTRITLASPYPNPTVGSVLIRLGLPEPASVDLRWYSVDGTQVGPTETRTLAAGTHSLEFQLGSRDDFASGVYFLEAAVGESRMRQRVVLTR